MNANPLMTETEKTPDRKHEVVPPMTDAFEDGELYVCKKGKLERIPRDDSEGERKVRITDEAFEAAISISKHAKTMLGWKPDLTLVISAIMIDRLRDENGNQQAVRQFLVQRLAQSEPTAA